MYSSPILSATLTAFANAHDFGGYNAAFDSVLRSPSRVCDIRWRTSARRRQRSEDGSVLDRGADEADRFGPRAASQLANEHGGRSTARIGECDLSNRKLRIGDSREGG